MRNTLKILLLLATVSLVFCQKSASQDYDLVIYGGTPAAVSAAVQMARMGGSCVLVVPEKQLGGASSGGLGHADIGIKQTIGGISLEFFQRIAAYYKVDSVWKFQERSQYQAQGNNHMAPDGGPMYTFEPQVAQYVFKQMVAEEPGIKVLYGERLDLNSGVTKKENTIVSVKTESGKVFKGEYFMDASYEGDLMALAGVSYHVGRESRDQYGESLAGVLGPTIKVRQPKALFGPDVSPYGRDGKLLPGIQDVEMGEVGTGDDKIQAYNFRICLTTSKENQLPIPKPANYHTLTYELLHRYIKAHGLTSIHQLLKISPIPNNKTDINDGCPFSTDYIGANWDYPEGDYQTRQRIWDDHYNFTLGMLYFIGHDSKVPASIREEMLQYGLPKDEYTEYGNWSPQLYIRETRRLMGNHILTQRDCQETTEKEQSIGMASYGPDSHHLQRIVYENGEVINEGNFLEPHEAYEIPLGVILPKNEECDNLLVPVCVSSSHIAFGSIRMEPVYMIMGQSAATLVGLALERKQNIHQVPYEILQSALLQYGQKIKLSDIAH